MPPKITPTLSWATLEPVRVNPRSQSTSSLSGVDRAARRRIATLTRGQKLSPSFPLTPAKATSSIS
jgi:hypothetical protein